MSGPDLHRDGLVARLASTALGLAVAASVAAPVASCRAVVGVEDRAPPADDTDEACIAPAGVAPACATCLGASCCAASEGCAGDPACSALAACVTACGADGACRDACRGAAPATALSTDLEVCLAASCAEACGTTCGGVGAPVLGCASCGEVCCALAEAAWQDPSFGALRACHDACLDGDVGCLEACASEHAPGHDRAMAIDACVARACEIDSDWSCVGRVEHLPSRQAWLRDVRVQVVRARVAVVEGATVSVCRELAPGCEDPISAAPTVAGEARVDLPVDPVTGAFAGFLAVDGEGLVPSWHFTSLPITTEDPLTLFVFDDDDFAALAAAADVELAPDRGVVIAAVTDCRGALAPGVTVLADTADGPAEPLYTTSVEGNLAPGDETRTGYAVFPNVAPGRFAVEGTITGLCRRQAALEARIAPGRLTWIDLWPSP